MNFKIHIALLIFILSVPFLNAQEKREDLEKIAENYFNKQEYVAATPYFLRLLSIDGKNINYNYKYGTCLLFSSAEKKEAFKFLNYAVQNRDEDALEPEAFYFLGQAFHLTYQFDKAIENYNIYKQKSGKKQSLKLDVDRQIEMCHNGKMLMSSINEIVVLKKMNVNRNNFFRTYDLANIGGQLLITEEFQSAKDKKMKHIPLIHFPANSDRIYYSSYGVNNDNKDIYTRFRLPSGEWSPPELVEGEINTHYDEDFPYMEPSGKYLYFSSKGHNSMGGFDIFKSEYNPATNSFGTPENLDFPISSPDNDFFYIADTLNRYAYFASQRNSAGENIEVYNVRVHRIPRQIIALKGNFKSDLNPSEHDLSIEIYDSYKRSIGKFKTYSNGDYLINFPKGGRYEFVMKVGNKSIIHKQMIDIPYDNIQNILKQSITEIKQDEREKLLINNEFDKGFEDEQAIFAEAVELQSKMAINVNQFDLDSLDRAQEQRKILDKIGLTNFSNIEIHDLIKNKYNELVERQENSKALLEKSNVFLEKINNDLQRVLESADSLLKRAEQSKNQKLAEEYSLLAQNKLIESKDISEKLKTLQNITNFIEKDYLEKEQLLAEAKVLNDAVLQMKLDDDAALMALLNQHQDFGANQLKNTTKLHIHYEYTNELNDKIVHKNNVKKKYEELAENIEEFKKKIEELNKEYETASKKRKTSIESELSLTENLLDDAKSELNYLNDDLKQIKQNQNQKDVLSELVNNRLEDRKVNEQQLVTKSEVLLEKQEELLSENKEFAEEKGFELSNEIITVELTEISSSEEHLATQKEQQTEIAEVINQENEQAEETNTTTTKIEENELIVENQQTKEEENEVNQIAQQENIQENSENEQHTEVTENISNEQNEQIEEQQVESQEEIISRTNEELHARIEAAKNVEIPANLETEAEKLEFLNQQKDNYLAEIKDSIELTNDPIHQTKIAAVEKEIITNRNQQIDNAILSIQNEERHARIINDDAIALSTIQNEINKIKIEKETINARDLIDPIEQRRQWENIQQKQSQTLEQIRQDENKLRVNQAIEEIYEANDFPFIDLKDVINSDNNLKLEQSEIKNKLKEIDNELYELNILSNNSTSEQRASLLPLQEKLRDLKNQLNNRLIINDARLNQLEQEKDVFTANIISREGKDLNLVNEERETLRGTKSYDDVYALHQELKEAQRRFSTKEKQIKAGQDKLRELFVLFDEKEELTEQDKKNIELQLRLINNLKRDNETIKQEILALQGEIDEQLNSIEYAERLKLENMLAWNVKPNYEPEFVSELEENLAQTEQHEIQNEVISPTEETQEIIAETTTQNQQQEVNEQQTERVETQQNEVISPTEETQEIIAETTTQNQQQEVSEQQTERIETQQNEVISPTEETQEIIAETTTQNQQQEVSEQQTERVETQQNEVISSTEETQEIIAETTTQNQQQEINEQQNERIETQQNEVISPTEETQEIIAETTTQNQQQEVSEQQTERVETQQNEVTSPTEETQEIIAETTTQNQQQEVSEQQNERIETQQNEVISPTEETQEIIAETTTQNQQQEVNEQQTERVETQQDEVISPTEETQEIIAETTTQSQQQEVSEQQNERIETQQNEVISPTEETQEIIAETTTQNQQQEVNEQQNERVETQQNEVISPTEETQELIAETTTQNINELINVQQQAELDSLQEVLNELNKKSRRTSTEKLTKKEQSEKVTIENEIAKKEDEIIYEAIENLSVLIEENQPNETADENLAILSVQTAQVENQYLIKQLENEKDPNKRLQLKRKLEENHTDNLEAIEKEQIKTKLEKDIQQIITQNNFDYLSSEDLTNTNSDITEEQEEIENQLLIIQEKLKDIDKQLTTVKKKERAELLEVRSELEAIQFRLENKKEDNYEYLAKKEEERFADYGQHTSETAIDNNVSYAEEVVIAQTKNYQKLYVINKSLNKSMDELKQKEEELQAEQKQLKEFTSFYENGNSPTTEELAALDEHLQRINRIKGELEVLRLKILRQEQEILALKPINHYEKNIIENLLAREVTPLRGIPTLKPIQTGLVTNIDASNVYSAENPIPEIERSMRGLFFRVQIGAFSRNVPDNTFKEFRPIAKEPVRPGLIRYVAGLFGELETASEAREQIRRMGYNDAFVVAYCDGERIPIQTAQELLRTGECIPILQGAEITMAVEEETIPEEIIRGTENTENTENTEITNNVPTQTIQPTIRKEVIESIEKNLDKFSYNKAPGAAEAEVAETKAGLFFTVQVGVYNKPVTAEELFNISPLVTKRLSNGQIRYSTGVFNSIEEAMPKRNEAIQLGITDAFITAYYQGKRITVAEALQLLSDKGESILELKNPSQTSDNKDTSSDENTPFVDEHKVSKMLISKERYTTYPTQLLFRYNRMGEVFYYDKATQRIQSFLLKDGLPNSPTVREDFDVVEYYNFVYPVKDKSANKRQNAVFNSEQDYIQLIVSFPLHQLTDDILNVAINSSANKQIKTTENSITFEFYMLDSIENKLHIDRIEANMKQLGATDISKNLNKIR